MNVLRSVNGGHVRPGVATGHLNVSALTVNMGG